MFWVGIYCGLPEVWCFGENVVGFDRDLLVFWNFDWVVILGAAFKVCKMKVYFLMSSYGWRVNVKRCSFCSQCLKKLPIGKNPETTRSCGFMYPPTTIYCGATRVTTNMYLI